MEEITKRTPGRKNATYHYYYDNQSVVEVRNGSDLVLTQYLWAGRAGGYVDELIQLAHTRTRLMARSRTASSSTTHYRMPTSTCWA